jgi:hypothetical protein
LTGPFDGTDKSESDLASRVSNDGQKLSVGEIFNLSEEYVQLF